MYFYRPGRAATWMELWQVLCVCMKCCSTSDFAMGNCPGKQEKEIDKFTRTNAKMDNPFMLLNTFSPFEDHSYSSL